MEQSSNSKTNPESCLANVSVSAFLNGKAKQDFLDYYWKNYIGKTRFLNQKSETEEFFNSLYPTLKTTLIIDFFDSIGFYIKIYPHLGGGQIVFYPSFIYRDEKYNENERNVLFDNGELYYSLIRQEAVFEAVKKANDVYNVKFFQAEH